MSALSACAGSESHFSSLRSRQRRTEPLPEAMRGTDTKRLPKRHLTYRLERIQENKSDQSEERRFRNLTDETNCLWRGEKFQMGDAQGQAQQRPYGEGLNTTKQEERRGREECVCGSRYRREAHSDKKKRKNTN